MRESGVKELGCAGVGEPRALDPGGRDVKIGSVLGLERFQAQPKWEMSVKEFFEKNGVHCTVESEAIREEGKPYDAVFFQDGIEVQRLSDLVEQWNAEQRAAKRGE